MADTAKALVTLDDGSTRELDLIEFQGQQWAVADWLSLTRNGPKTPRRLFRLDSLAYQLATEGRADVNVTTPLTDALLREGPAPAGSGLDILDAQFKMEKDGALRHSGYAPPMQRTVQ